MSPPRFTPEFKYEAVCQITERGYSVAEVSARLGVSAHSLYKWVSAVKPVTTSTRLGLIDDIVISIVVFLVVSLRNTDGTVIQGANSDII